MERELLKQGDKVVMHTCIEAKRYNGKIWTCKTDEYTKGDGAYKQNLVFLEGFSGCFSTEYLQKVNIADNDVNDKNEYIDSLENTFIFMCKVYDDITTNLYKLAEKGNHAVFEVPLVQGTSNIINISLIGELEYRNPKHNFKDIKNEIMRKR